MTFTQRIQRWSHSVAVPTAGNASVISAPILLPPARRKAQSGASLSIVRIGYQQQGAIAQNKHPRRHLRIASPAASIFPSADKGESGDLLRYGSHTAPGGVKLPLVEAAGFTLVKQIGIGIKQQPLGTADQRLPSLIADFRL